MTFKIFILLKFNNKFKNRPFKRQNSITGHIDKIKKKKNKREKIVAQEKGYVMVPFFLRIRVRKRIVVQLLTQLLYNSINFFFKLTIGSVSCM
jgi:CRISPR/Cas system CMR subunit Cmr6 (Cas7 group RAMP superfamily)